MGAPDVNDAVPGVTLGRMMRTAIVGAAVVVLSVLFRQPSPAQNVSPAGAGPRHAIAMHGQPALPEGFDHFAYANPDAPKGGRLVEGLAGTFDSLNPLIVKGLPVQQIRNYVIESLMARGNDEPFTLYGLLAETIETDGARSYVTFHLRPEAKFADGHAVTADDLLFSWDLLKNHGRPNHRLYYGKVTRAVVLDRQTVRFELGGGSDRELPLILGLMPVLPKHAIDVASFEDTSFSAPLGSGPYRVTKVKPGAGVTLTRNPDYWGRNLPVNRGLWNFDEVQLDFYRDANSAFEAFKRGLYDFRVETEPLRWHSGYDFAAANEGRVVRETIADGAPEVSDYFVFNTRRAPFSDIRVREALTLLFDFEWVNRNYFFGLYRRSPSYFPGSELSAYERPETVLEKTLLAPFASEVRPDIADGSYRLPVTDASGRDRDTLKQALSLLADAGYELSGNALRSRTDGRPFTFEILVSTRDQERIGLAFARDLRRAGIEVSVRVADAVQFDERRLTFDFDMIEHRYDQSLSPGNEQYFYFGSEAAANQGTRNYMGVKSAAVDAMIAAMLDTHERSDFVAAVRALDRLLMSGSYAIPLFSVPDQWIARWTQIERPQKSSLIGYLPETWWHRR